MAIAERHLAAVFGDDVVDHQTYVLASDGDLMEGISQEAIALAGHLKLNRLIVLFDDNGISIDGPLSLADSVDQVKRFEAAGWSAARIDGHDPEAIACSAREGARRPTARPDRLQDHHRLRRADQGRQREKSHGSPLGADEIEGAREKLGWTRRRSKFRPTSSTAWRAAGTRAQAARTRLGTSGSPRSMASKRAEFERRMRGDLPKQALADAVARSEGEARGRSRRKSRPARPPSSRSKA